MTTASTASKILSAANAYPLISATIDDQIRQVALRQGKQHLSNTAW